MVILQLSLIRYIKCPVLLLQQNVGDDSGQQTKFNCFKQGTNEVLGNRYGNLIMTTTNDSLYPGNHVWVITNDEECAEREMTRKLSLSTCLNDSYTCDSGACIPISKREERYQML